MKTVIPMVMVAVMSAPLWAALPAPPAKKQDAPAQLDPITVTGHRLPVPRRRFNPPYPMSARHRWEEGCVVLRFTVRADGKTDDFAVLDSQPQGVFERSVIGAVFKWEYDPSPAARTMVEVFKFRHPQLDTSPRYTVRETNVEKVSGSSPQRYRVDLAMMGYQPPKCRVPQGR